MHLLSKVTNSDQLACDTAKSETLVETLAEEVDDVVVVGLRCFMLDLLKVGS